MPPPQIPSLNWLRIFEAAARHGSFARAAETLNMSPSAVSQQIRALETFLGRPLFTRGPRSVTLTAAGHSFLPVIARSLHQVEVATGNVFGDRQRKPLSISCTLILASGWLAGRLPDFQARHPDIQLSLTTARLDNEYRRQDADLTILFGLPPEPFEDSDPLFGEILCPVAPPEIAARIKTPEDLAVFPLVEVATHRANWQALLPADATPRIQYTDNTLTAFAIAAGGSVALDRRPATGDLAQRFGLVPCLQDQAISGVQSYSLVYPARPALRAPARAFRDWLLMQAQQLD